MRYFFSRLDGGFDPDTEGVELSDLQTARHEAILYAAGTVRDHPEYVWTGGEMRIEVTDERGLLATTVIIMSVDASDPEKVMRSYVKKRKEE